MMASGKYNGYGMFQSKRYSFIGVYKEHKKTEVGLYYLGNRVQVCNWDNGMRNGPAKKMSPNKTIFYLFNNEEKKEIEEEDFENKIRNLNSNAKALYKLSFEKAMRMLDDFSFR